MPDDRSRRHSVAYQNLAEELLARIREELPKLERECALAEAEMLRKKAEWIDARLALDEADERYRAAGGDPELDAVAALDGQDYGINDVYPAASRKAHAGEVQIQ